MNLISLSEYKKAAIQYIAGFVARAVQDTTVCQRCAMALGSTRLQTDGFVKFKDRGGLFKPTKSVHLLCLETEKCFQRKLSATDNILPQCRGIQNAVCVSVLEKFGSMKIFLELDDHMKECAIEDNHVYSPVKTIAKCYCKIRFFHLAKSYQCLT